jgi:predicted nucleic acid-binding protein
MPNIVDANVAIRWIVPEDDLDAQALVVRDSVDRFEAPDLILSELANISWKKWRSGLMTREEAEGGIAAIRGYFHFHSSADLCERAFALSLALDHPAYDCFYLACAEATSSVLITADRRLHDLAVRAGFGHLVQHLAEVALP